MDSKDLKALMESYSAVYQDENDLQEDFDAIDELTDQELEEVVEEVILNLLDEGYSIDDVEEIFEEEICEEIIAEAKVDMAARAAARKQYAQSSEKAAGQARKAGAAVVAKEKRAAQVARVKGAVKSGVAKVKSAIKSGVERAKSTARKAIDEPARKYAEKRGVVPSKSGKTSLGSGTGIGSVAYKQRTSAGRREVRSAVASDIAQRAAKKAGEMKRSATQKAASAAVSGYAAARSAKQAVSDTAGRAAQSVKNKAAVAKRGVSAAASGAKSAVKSGVGKLARKLASKAGSVASRLGEEVDFYDLVLEHLIREGYAETQDQAVKIMANMSEEWRTEIIKSEIHS